MARSYCEDSLRRAQPLWFVEFPSTCPRCAGEDAPKCAPGTNHGTARHESGHKEGRRRSGEIGAATTAPIGGNRGALLVEFAPDDCQCTPELVYFKGKFGHAFRIWRRSHRHLYRPTQPPHDLVVHNRLRSSPTPRKPPSAPVLGMLRSRIKPRLISGHRGPRPQKDTHVRLNNRQFAARRPPVCPERSVQRTGNCAARIVFERPSRSSWLLGSQGPRSALAQGLHRSA